MKTINIHGKEYVEVHERIMYFRKNFKDWSLTTEIVELTDKRCVMKASIGNEKDRVIATGTAYETMGSSYINKTSFIENCETSAWGRALGNLGIGIDTNIASADEVKNAIAQERQSDPKPKAKKPEPKKLTNAQLGAMIVAIGNGKEQLVKDSLPSYIISKVQMSKIENCIKLKAEKPSEIVKAESPS